MLEYGLPETPEEGQRWFIRGGVGGKEYRYLHLERKNAFGFWVTVHKTMISNYTTKGEGFQQSTKEAAHDVLREIKVNFNLPTGEVR